MDAKTIINNLTLDDYERIFNDLGATDIIKKDHYWQLPTICHNLSEEDASHKLYFYLDTKTTFCFTECQKSRDIIDLISARWELEGRSGFTFPQILKYICDVCSVDYEGSNIITQPSWKNRLAVYNVQKKSQYLGKRYDKNILAHLKPHYSDTFINDGISVDTMKKFGIAFYPSARQITIPVYDLDGELVGVHCRNLDDYKIIKGKKYIPLHTKSGLDYRFKAHEVLYGMNMNEPMIKQHKEIQLFESPKAVLQLDTMYDNQTTAVGMFGMNLGKHRRDMILKMGVREVIIGIDKDYEDEIDEAYISNVRKIAGLFKGYCKCSVMYDADNLLGHKQSPTDVNKEVYERLYQNRMTVEI